jgi:signal transduction histidine kinase
MKSIFTRGTRFRPKISEIPIKNLITTCQDELKNLDGCYRLEMKITIEGCLPFFSDAEQLKIVFGNLISNSIRYQHPHEVKPQLNITVEVDGNRARFEFRDNGIGISAESLPRVFDMFYRSPGTKGDGAGLGLFMVKEIIKKLKGKITVESKRNEGTKFVFEIPNLIDPDHLRKLSKLIQN